MSAKMGQTMKGFQEQTDDGGVFFQIKHNTICQESKTEREGYKPVEATNPRTDETVIKFIKPYKAIEAMVTKIEWRDTEQQFDQRYLSWKIYLNANGKIGVLEISFQSRASSRFMKLAENIDFTKPVEFRAWKDHKTNSTAFFVGQGGHSIPQKYTKENPEDCPPPKKSFAGKWNFDDQMEFLHKRMLDVVIPKVEAVAATMQYAKEDTNGEPEFDSTAPEYVDDEPPL